MKYFRGLLILSILFFGGLAIAFPFFARARENARRQSCASNLKNIALGFREYLVDNDNRFPFVASNSKAVAEAKVKEKYNSKGWRIDTTPAFGWVDAMQPNMKSTSVFQCPSNVTWPINWGYTRPGCTVYWMNGNLSGARINNVSSPARTFLTGDGDGRDLDTTARYNKVGPPTQTYDDRQPVWTMRHLGGANYSFVDGHVKWLKPEEISTRPGAAYTFSPK